MEGSFTYAIRITGSLNVLIWFVKRGALAKY